jgi:hypothetical protein
MDMAFPPLRPVGHYGRCKTDCDKGCDTCLQDWILQFGLS